MKKKNKKKIKFRYLFIILFIIILCVCIILINKNKKVKNIEVENIINTNEKVNEIKNVDGYEFSNIELRNYGEITFLDMLVTNKSGNDVRDFKDFKISYIGEDDQEKAYIETTISPLKNNEYSQVAIQFNNDIRDINNLIISSK